MRKTQICVRAALAIQHVLHDIASGSVLRIDSRKRVIVTNRFFAKVKLLYLTVFMWGRDAARDKVFEPDTAHSAHIHGYQHITIYVHSAFATNASLSILSVQPCMHPHNTKSTQHTATRIRSTMQLPT